MTTNIYLTSVYEWLKKGKTQNNCLCLFAKFHVADPKTFEIWSTESLADANAVLSLAVVAPPPAMVWALGAVLPAVSVAVVSFQHNSEPWLQFS